MLLIMAQESAEKVEKVEFFASERFPRPNLSVTPSGSRAQIRLGEREEVADENDT
jgi:hypothetical protein